MPPCHPRCSRLLAIALLLGWGAVIEGPGAACAASRRIDPAQIVPLDQIDPRLRDSVAEVIREPSFHRQGQSETFPANAKLYLALLNEPALTLALWQDLSPTPAQLRQVGPGRYEGHDGAGTSAIWEFAYRSSRLHVLHCSLEYASPRGATRLNGRIVIVVHTGFFKDSSGDPWVKHDIEAFVKIDSRGWRTVGLTVRPLIEKLLEDQVQEAGWFVSLMARLVETYPSWAVGVCVKQEQIPQAARQAFRELVLQTRRPGAIEGRPQLVAEGGESLRR